MNNLNWTVGDIKDDVINAYDKICLLIGHSLITSGTKDKELLGIAKKLDEVCVLMNAFSKNKN